jgi:membrane dipeptidase
VAKKRKPTLDDLLNHADYIVKVAGVEHLSVGIDYYEGMAGVANDEEAKALYDKFVKAGVWNPRDYGPRRGTIQKESRCLMSCPT